MNVTTSIALNLMSIVVVLIIIITMQLKRIDKTFSNIIFTLILIMIMIYLVVDCVYLSLYETDYYFANIVMRVFKNLYFIINFTIPLMWVLYLDSKLYGDPRHIIKMLPVYLIPSIINICIVNANVFANVLFVINNDNQMVVKTIPMIVYTCVSYLYVLFILIIIIINRKKLSNRKFWSLIVFPLPIIVLSIVQISFRNISLICGYAISAIIFFLSFQNDLAIIDDLTGVYNRRYLTSYLASIIKKRNNGKYCYGIMLDIDKLKYINDNYGHVEGDNVLRSVSEILRASTKKNDMIFRYGGDEFILVSLTNNTNDIFYLLESIENNRKIFNKNHRNGYDIEFSMGYYMVDDQEHINVDEFLQKIDESMYIVKRNLKK